MLARVAKLFGKPPSEYFNLDNQYINIAIDVGCATAFWEDENYRHKKAKETAQSEAGEIGRVLEEAREEIEGRG